MPTLSSESNMLQLICDSGILVSQLLHPRLEPIYFSLSRLQAPLYLGNARLPCDSASVAVELLLLQLPDPHELLGNLSFQLFVLHGSLICLPLQDAPLVAGELHLA